MGILEQIEEKRKRFSSERWPIEVDVEIRNLEKDVANAQRDLTEWEGLLEAWKMERASLVG